MATVKFFAKTFLFCLFALTSTQKEGPAFAQSWRLDAVASPRCLLFNELVNTNPVIDGPPVSSFANASGDPKNELQIVLADIAKRITTGIAVAHQAVGSVASDPHADVDLTILIANEFDKQCVATDDYWQYYIDCDRWDVVFCQPAAQAFTSSPAVDALQTNLVARVSKLWTQNVKSLNASLRQMEFSYVEDHCSQHCHSAQTLDKGTDPLKSKFVSNLSTIAAVSDQPLWLALRSVPSKISKIQDAAKDFSGAVANRLMTMFFETVHQYASTGRQWISVE